MTDQVPHSVTIPQFHCLVGESGAGKSTLALAVMGLLPANAYVGSGSIYFDGVDLLRADQEYLRTLRGNHISMVFQDAQSALNPVQLVGDQLEEVILEHTNVSRRVANRMAQDILREMGLPRSGSIYFDGVDLLRADQEYLRTLRGNHISMVFQDAQSALNPVQLVGDQLEEVILEHTNVSRRVANRMAQDILREMGLPDPRRIMGQYPFSLRHSPLPGSRPLLPPARS